MRIISGYLKGKKIDQPSNKFTRPLKDLTKESIFNILQHSNLINFSLDNSSNRFAKHTADCFTVLYLCRNDELCLLFQFFET